MDKTYIPLYRKYRPHTFDDVVGQEVVVKTLKNAIVSNRVAHAYLFCGPRGTGKTSIARIFARTLNCLNPIDNKPCGKCPHCIDMENAVPMDVIEIDAASNRKVEDARDILEKVYYHPAIGKNKIYIIDEVHMLTKEAFNTLLKTLEEPPENLVFILATTESHKVLETIVSRCQKFDFRRITVKDIENRLKFIAQNENINIEDKALEFIARKSAGGLRDALALLDQSSVLASNNEMITKEDITSLLGNISDNDLFEITNAIIEKNPQKIIILSKNILDNGNDPLQIIKELTEYLRNVLLASVCDNVEEASTLLDVSPENCQQILSQSKQFDKLELAQILDELKNQETNIKNSSNPYIWMDVALISITTRENIIAQKAILTRIENLEKNLGQTASKQPEQVPISKPVINTIDKSPQTEKSDSETNTNSHNIEHPIKTNNISDTQQNEVSIEKAPVSDTTTNTEPKQTISQNSNYSWDTFLGMLQKINAVAFALIKPHSRIIEFSENKIVLGFRNEIFVKQATSKKMFLEQTAKEYFGKIPEFTFKLISEQDFKKKINNSQNHSDSEIIHPVSPAPQGSTIPDIDEEQTEEDKKIYEFQGNTSFGNNTILSDDLSDNVKNFIDVFGGKLL